VSLTAASFVLLWLPGLVGSSPAARTPAPRPPVVLVVLENHEYSAIVGSGSAPYVNHTLLRKGTLFTSYHAVSHPSLPNYLAMTSGSLGGKAGTDRVRAGEIGGDNLFHQLSAAGLSWRAFQGSMPQACYRRPWAGRAPHDYALKHDPAMTYRDVAKGPLCRHVVPLRELAPNHLPRFSFITPDECDDMHSCPVRAGDTWLSRHVPSLLRHGALVVVTFDEGTTSAGGGGRVMTVMVGPGVARGARNRTPYTHDGLLAGLERHFHLPLLGRAKVARPLPI
jgi:hypothetical protein